MSDEDMVAYLARCQLDPAMPRASIETLLHAFVPAPHVHHTHPDGINVLAGTADGERLMRRVLRRRRGLDPVHPPRLHALQAGRRGGARQPGPEAGRAGQARPDRLGRDGRGGLPQDDRGHQPGRRVRQRAHGRASPRFGGRKLRGRATPALLRELLPAIRGAVSSERAKVLTVDTSDRALEFVSSVAGRAARDRRRAVPGPPRAHQARAAVDPVRPRDRRRGVAARADRRARRRLPRRLPRLLRGQRRRRRRARRPGRADRARPGPRARRRRARRRRRSKISRDLYHRAIEVMAGAQALGEFVSLDAAESFAIEYWPLELYKLAQAPPPGRAAGQGRARHRRRRRHRARDHRHARLRGRVRRRLRPRRGGRHRGGRRATATAAWRSPAT